VLVRLTVGPANCNSWLSWKDRDSFRRAKGLFTVSYVSDSRVDVTDPYNWVRSYAIATVAGRKRVTAVVNPAYPAEPDKAANAPYAASNALAWTFMMRLRETSRT